MHTYISEELPSALFSSFEQLDAERMSICGHSMGGHGALILVGSILFPGSYIMGVCCMNIIMY